MPITPSRVANIDEIGDVKLSFNGEHVVYTLSPAFHVKDTNSTSALWLADVGTPNSARQITSGAFNDTSPAFDPNTGDIFFLSDRHKAGCKPQLYRLSARPFSGEPIPVTDTKNVCGVTEFEISPDGRWLAYASADEPEDKDEEKKESYVTIWRTVKKHCRLRILDLSGKVQGARTAVAVDKHVSSMAWSPDSTQIIYRLTRSPELEDNYFPASEHVVSIGDNGQFTSIHVVTHEFLPRPSVWPSKKSFYYLGKANLFDSPSLYSCSISADSSPTRLHYGDTDDAMHVVTVGSGAAVSVACGLETSIDIIEDGKKLFTAFHTFEEGISSWDMKKVGNKYVFVAVRSSGVTGEVENVWSTTIDKMARGVLQTQLSSHHEWLVPNETPQSAPFYWTASDGTALQGIIVHRRGRQPENSPTVVVPHGGPYFRDVLNLRLGLRYTGLLASRGFLVLCPNYRGSQGRGSAFTKAAQGGMGTVDYADCESMLDAAIVQGLASSDKVAIAGYSQGGFLSAWGITRPNARWKTACIGAAPTDWGSMAISSDLPDLEAHLGGSAPWFPRTPNPAYLNGSPMADVKNVKVPVLLLHGEKDQRVPLSQAIGFMRGLVREVDETVSERSQLVIYPREGHGFVERAHVEDHLTRVLEHLKKYLSDA
ncbi:Peptidase-S9 domain-containing protein [Mycena indigotica]|uniref:Dipeptidyl-peptidase V n=1 Tax=Mycena indigotica TaxID=2126181 RepID=A0A8H6SE82_9AGAR|nr:Peptidase-S9 domain-containing protein [Mycena indigotica]KAF7297323.1 Peptidase-S9 domain-containing protein [Mycena indigotica]